jgi:cellobiose phosphorylase
VTKPQGLCKGVKSVTVDGKAIEGNLVPVLGKGNHTIDVVMG